MRQFTAKRVTFELLRIGTLENPDETMRDLGLAEVTGPISFTFRLSGAESDRIAEIIEAAAKREIEAIK